MQRFQDRPDEGIQRIRYAVETLGVDVVKDGDRNDTALCKSPRLEFSEELVRLGAVVRGRGDSSQSLVECAMYYAPRDSRVAEWAMQFQDLDVLNDRGESPLCFAAREATLKQVDVLLKAGADPNLHDPENPSSHPPVCAVGNYRPWSEVERIIEALEAAGARIESD